MFSEVIIFTLLNVFIPVKSGLQKSGIAMGRDKNGAKILCSQALNCTCLFEELRVTVECTSAGDKLDKISSELPKTTTHL